MKNIVIIGGHHSSALPVISELKKRYPTLEISWFGHKYSVSRDKNTTLEFREITALQIPFYNLNAGKFYRTFNPFKLLKIPLGFVQSFALLVKLKPEIIVSFGGYLAVPVVIVGKLLGIPAVTHEQTVVVGYANKIISKFASKVLISWPESSKYFNLKKVVETGLPLRAEIFTVLSNDFPTNTDLPTLYITAGKTGSHILNTVVNNTLEKLLSSYNIIHQTGDVSFYKDYDVLVSTYQIIKEHVPGRYFPRKFVYSQNIGEAFSKANLVISRSGAHTCQELIALNKPALLIPIPWVSHNEQYLNAREVSASHLAEIIEEKNLNPESLVQTINAMFTSLEKYKLVNKKPILNSAELITDEIEKTYKNKTQKS